MELFVRPAGPADAEELAEVQSISWQATYRGLLSPELLARTQAAWDAWHWRRSLERTDAKGFALVLEGRDAGIVGFGVAGPRRGGREPLLRGFGGEIYLLYLLPDFQRRGNGARLMGAMARVLKARGIESALVWALAANEPAVGFYRRLAGSFLMECRKPFFGETVNEIALGWRDLGRLTEMSWKLRE
jgi:ribosomal protein S18 acetylase RimI-like enzyme